jgi:uncharacterized phage-associated protein
MSEANHDSRAVANKLIRKGIKEKKYFTPLQLMKLVYYCHAWMLGIHGKKLLGHKIMAWKYGPVISELYGETRRFGRSKIKKNLGYEEFEYEFDEEFTDEEDHLINQVYEAYSNRNGIELSSMTHQEGTPWHTTWHKSYFDNRSIISDDLMQEYYARRYQELSKEG